MKGIQLEIRVKLFAALAHRARTRDLDVELPKGSTVSDLTQAISRNWPELADLIGVVNVAVNHQFVSGDQVLHPSDEIALIPPVSGGSTENTGTPGFGGRLFAITEEPLSADRLVQMVVNPHTGATLAFCGTVREFTRGRRTVHLEYEAYREMAERMLEQIGQEIGEKWPGTLTAIHHRVGKLEISELSVVIAVATPHRAESFEAGRYAIERIKQIVPIWKKEVWEDGETWVGSQTYNPT